MTTLAPVRVVTPALYETAIQHVRQTPIKHSFDYASYWWLVDLDDLPVLPHGLARLAQFRSEDHIGDPTRSIRANLDALLAEHGLRADRVVMLANARTLGHVFNPLSIHWCLSAAGDVLAVVAEVHNTYGGRHAYVLQVDEKGRTATEKAFYVSPFNPVDGHYEMRLPLPTDALRIDMTYHRPTGRPFVATVRGTRTPVTTRSVLSTALRHPLSTRLVSLRIRLHGIRLYLRRLPVVPRDPQEQTS